MQNAFEREGKQYLPGTKIPVACKFCLLWKRPLAVRGGRPLCMPGQVMKVSNPKNKDKPIKWRAQEDRWSCQLHYIPPDMEAALDFVTDDVDLVSSLRSAFPLAKAGVRATERVRKSCAKAKIENADEMAAQMREFAAQFSSQEQIDYVKPFVTVAVDALRATLRKATTPRKEFAPGDEVEWTDANTGKQVKGFLKSYGGPKKTVGIIVSGPSAVVLRPALKTHPRPAIVQTYEIEAWKKMNPTVTMQVCSDEE